LLDRRTFLLRWIVIIGLPLVVMLTSARALITPWYPSFEYTKTDFPPDPYGFTLGQRLDLARVAIDYLNTGGPPAQHIHMLEEQRLPGTAAPLYTPREISHMIDVKTFTDLLWRVYAIAGLVVGGSFVALFARRSTRAAATRALRTGGLVTVSLLGALLFFVLTGWSLFFTQFHEAFFPPGTWTFEYGSSLIRLFPDKLWFDGGVILVGSALAIGFVAAAAGHLLYGRWRLAGAA
jgi:integral membrane protein (TIGR01906 family)